MKDYLKLMADICPRDFMPSRVCGLPPKRISSNSQFQKSCPSPMTLNSLNSIHPILNFYLSNTIQKLPKRSNCLFLGDINWLQNKGVIRNSISLG
jgi:hypothetical protein